jgi:Trk K+ transport system NAD-binding subunit
MNIFFAVSLVLAVAALYLFVIETFSVAFKLTGLASKKIRFQVASLFTGSGFTTNESEIIVNDDKRRRIAVTCMYVGHIFSVVFMGLITNVLISVATTLLNTDVNFLPPADWYYIVFFVTLGLLGLMLFLKIPPINKRFQNMLEKIAIAASTKDRKTNIINVIDLYGKNAIVEVILNNIPDFAVDAPLYKMQLTNKYFINVLSIKRGTKVIEVNKDTMFAKGDILVLFGSTRDIKSAFIDSVSKDKKKTIVINNANEMNLLSNYGSNVLMEIDVEEVPPEFDGVPLKDAHLSDRYNINIMVIKRNDEYVLADKDTIIQKGDEIALFGPYHTIKRLFKNTDK